MESTSSDEQIFKSIFLNTVDSRYLNFAYLE